jgi:hypothetical protein
MPLSSLALLTFLYGAAGPAALQAAQALPSFASLDSRLLVNRTVSVKTSDPRNPGRTTKIKGRVLSVSESVLRLEVDGATREYSPSEVLVISERDGGARQGAIVGLAAGGSFGVLLASNCLKDTHTCRILAPIGAAMAAAGTAMGAAIGASSTHERVLYLAPTQRKPRRPRALMITPAVVPGAAALWATYSFDR